MTYLGTIDINVNLDRSAYEYGMFRYSFHMSFENNLKEDLEWLKAIHPGLYEKYRGNIKLP